MNERADRRKPDTRGKKLYNHLILLTFLPAFTMHPVTGQGIRMPRKAG
jgi:hypothetical protein